MQGTIRVDKDLCKGQATEGLGQETAEIRNTLISEERNKVFAKVAK